MQKSYEEINEKIRRGQAVVVTAEEVIDIVAEKGLDKAAQEIDVVTTGTFGPMCSSRITTRSFSALNKSPVTSIFLLHY
jgi:uncharacterized protein (DUF39 family)